MTWKIWAPDDLGNLHFSTGSTTWICAWNSPQKYHTNQFPGLVGPKTGRQTGLPQFHPIPIFGGTTSDFNVFSLTTNGVSINRGPPKMDGLWRKSYKNGWVGGTPISGNLQIYLKTNFQKTSPGILAPMPCPPLQPPSKALGTATDHGTSRHGYGHLRGGAGGGAPHFRGGGIGGRARLLNSSRNTWKIRFDGFWWSLMVFGCFFLGFCWFFMVFNCFSLFFDGFWLWIQWSRRGVLRAGLGRIRPVTRLEPMLVLKHRIWIWNAKFQGETNQFLGGIQD